MLFLSCVPALTLNQSKVVNALDLPASEHRRERHRQATGGRAAARQSNHTPIEPTLAMGIIIGMLSRD